MSQPLTAWHPEKPPRPAPLARQEKRQQQAEELCAAAIRAYCAEPRLRFRGHRLERGGRRLPIYAPHLKTDMAEDDFRSFRGAADGLALRLKHSDLVQHRHLMPEEPLQRLVFELLEQLRVESLVGDNHPGMQRNLAHRFRTWCLQFHNAQMTENQVGLLFFTIAQIAWSRLTGNPTLEETEGLIEQQRAVLAPCIGTDLLGLRRQRENQFAYAQHALAIAAVLAGILEAIERENGGQTKPSEEREESRKKLDRLLAIDQESDAESDELSKPGSTARPQHEKDLSEALEDYRVFSRDYDKMSHAATLVRSDQLRQLREQLDGRIRTQGINIPRLARQLARLLSAPRLNGWSFGHEEGHLDARRLSRLVTSPAERRVFRQEQRQPHTDCQVSVLIDNSGSMKEHIESIALLVDVFSRALEQAGARTEILGFTTGAWNGGKPYKQWLGRGRPADPGRVSELHHLIYKAADTSWRRARAQIAALLKPSLFREGVDGEALLWASQRLQESQASRKILIVISDGSPMDSATHLANGADYLDRHLQQVAGLIENGGEMELYALGVGLDLSNFYRRSLALDLSQSLDNRVFDEIVQLLA